MMSFLHRGAVSDNDWSVAEEHRLTRTRFRTFFLHQPPSQVLMEACGSAHHWGRELQALGHQVTLLPASHVARYRIGDKTDRADTRAILEAARNDKITPVPVKSLHQQAITALHRLRSGYLVSRTAKNLANYLGLTPREASSGLRRRMGRISKRGDTYTRMLLVHGARSALLAAHRVKDPEQLQAWAIRTAKARGHNIATVALANRIARIS